MTGVVKDVVRYLSAEVLLKAIGVVSLLYAGKILEPAEFGYFAMTLFVVALSTSLADFGATSLILRDYHADGSRCLIRALPVAAGIAAGISAVIVVAGTRIAELNQAFLPLAQHPYLVCALVVLSPITLLICSFLIVSLRARVFTGSVLAKSFVHMVTLVILVTLNRSYESQLEATLAGELTLLAVVAVRFRSRIAEAARYLWSQRFDRVIEHQLRSGGVFLARDVLGVGQGYLSRLTLSALVPVSELGIYSFYLNIVLSLNLFLVAVDRVYTPRMISMYRETPDRLRGLLVGLLPLIVVGVTLAYLGMVTAGEVGIYRLAFRAEYVRSASILDSMLFLLLTSAFLQMVSFSYYVGVRNSSARDTTAANLVSLVVFQLLLIPRYGVRGAVMADVLASGVRLGFLWFINKDVLVARGEWRAFAAFFGMLACAIGVVWLNLAAGLPWVLFVGLIAMVTAAYAATVYRQSHRSLMAVRTLLGVRAAA